MSYYCSISNDPLAVARRIITTDSRLCHYRDLNTLHDVSCPWHTVSVYTQECQKFISKQTELFTQHILHRTIRINYLVDMYMNVVHTSTVNRWNFIAR